MTTTPNESGRLNTMEKKLDSLERKVDRVLLALGGDGLNTDKGLVEEFKALRERVGILEAWKMKFVSAAAAIGLLLGWVISRAWEYFNK